MVQQHQLNQLPIENGSSRLSRSAVNALVAAVRPTKCDSNYVIRAALEPIIEETSDDDENGIADPWTEMEHTTWSSESETGSVIRVEIHQGNTIRFHYDDAFFITVGGGVPR